MNLTDYIASRGTARFAEEFNVSVRTAESWRQGRRRPEPEMASRIVDQTLVTWEGIYRPGGERVRGMRPTLRTKRRRMPLNKL